MFLHFPLEGYGESFTELLVLLLMISTDTKAEPLACGTSRAKLRNDLPPLVLEANAPCSPTWVQGKHDPPVDGLHPAVAALS